MDGNAEAAAILVQTAFASSDGLRASFEGKSRENPQAGMELLKPWYAEALKMVSRTRLEIETKIRE